MSNQDSADDDIAAWELPFLEESLDLDDNKTNAFNRKSGWKYEPPEVDEEPPPPTAEDIAQIRDAAYQEGFEQGKADGHKEGLESGTQQGYDEGKEQGMAEGREQGVASGQEEVQQQIETWSQLVEHLHQPVAKVDDQLQSELVKLSVMLAKAVIRHEINTQPEIILGALAEGLKVLPIKESHYQIRLHPEDAELVRNHFGQEHIDSQNWILVDAPDIRRGGCDISTNSNAVDVTVECRVKDVLETFILQQGLTDLSAD